MALYDINGKALNVGGGAGSSNGGISPSAAALLITILRNAVYDSNQSANITALENALTSGGADEPDEPIEPDVPEEPSEPEQTDIHDGYVSDGLEFRLDGIRNTPSGHVANTNWQDVSGNSHAVTYESAGNVVMDTHIDVTYRNTVIVTDYAAILSKLQTFTFEVVYKPKSAITNTNEKIPLVCVGNDAGSYPIMRNGQMGIYGTINTKHGTFNSGESKVNHYTVTYDGTKQTLYHESNVDVEVIASVDITTATKLHLFGNKDWASHAGGYHYALRVYSRALSVDEIKANYDNDIARFGEVG